MKINNHIFIKFFLYTTISTIIFIIYKNNLLFDNNNGSKILLVIIVAVIVNGIGAYFFQKKIESLTNKIDKKINNSNFDLLENEVILENDLASYYKYSFYWYGGKLFVTNLRFCYVAYTDICKNKIVISLPFDTIKTISIKNNNLNITNKDNLTYRFKTTEINKYSKYIK